MRRTGLFARLVTVNVALLAIALVTLGFSLDRVLERRALDALEQRLAAEAREVRTAIGGVPAASLEDRVRALGAASGSRLTVIRSDGVVLADSEHDPATMENHAGRPEVRAANAGTVGTSQRVSPTLGSSFLYVAIPPVGGVIVRAALDAQTVANQRGAVRRTVVLVFGILLVLGVAISALVARSVSRPLRRMVDRVADVGSKSFAIDPGGPREAVELADAINAMAADIATLLDELRSETHLREQILSSMQEGVMLAGPDGSIVYTNPAARSWFGDIAALPTSLQSDGAGEMTIHHPERRELRTASIGLADERRLVVAQDVTRAVQLDEMRRDLVANASHELKTPVGAILATAETMADAARDDPENLRRFSAMLVRDAKRLSRLVEDLLDLARLESGPPADASVALSDVVRDEIERVEPAAAGKGLRMETEVDGGVMVRGDTRDLALAVGNLLDNAVRYTQRGSITVRLVADNGNAVIAVSDTGPGIAAKHLSRIFERFYRVDAARSRETGGTGLGLSIVRHVVERLGGTVSAQSELGNGSTFTLTLPRVT